MESFLAQLKFIKMYNLSGYSVLNIPIKYIPNEIGLFELPLMLYFDNFIHSPPINIVMRYTLYTYISTEENVSRCPSM